MTATSTDTTPAPAQPMPLLGYPLPTLDAVLTEHRRDRTLMAATLHYLNVPEEEVTALAAMKGWRRMADRIALERRAAWQPIHSESVVLTVLFSCKNVGQREPERHNVLMAMCSAGVGEGEICSLLKLEQEVPPIRPAHLNRLLADRIASALEQAERPISRLEILKLRTAGEFVTLAPRAATRRPQPRSTRRVRLLGDQPVAVRVSVKAAHRRADNFGVTPRRRQNLRLPSCGSYCFRSSAKSRHHAVETSQAGPE